MLEVGHNASVETIDAAYRALSARVRERQGQDPRGAALARTALEEAYRTLSSEHLRRRYDLRIGVAPASALAVPDERGWFARNSAWLVLSGLVAVSAYGYHRHVQNDRAAAARELKEKEELIARQQAEREDANRRAAEAEDLRKKRIEEARYQVWVDQTRRESAAHARRQEQEESRQRLEEARQRRIEEMAQQREEAQARARLEQDKRRLQALEQQNYGHRGY